MFARRQIRLHMRARHPMLSERLALFLSSSSPMHKIQPRYSAPHNSYTLAFSPGIGWADLPHQRSRHGSQQTRSR